MDVAVTQQGKVTVVSFTGALDAAVAEMVGSSLDAQVRSGNTRLVADVGQVGYVSSAGLRALVRTLKDTNRKGGDFRLANVQASLQRSLEITGLTSLFKTYPSVEAAVASFAA
ncbi:MAG TPA: STAS domain-containing protein [Anaerolineae bacterium]|nr:STAS domain-containing protein [Anaerolineae bacterium]